MQDSSFAETSPISVTERVEQFIQDQRVANQWELSTVKMMRTLQHHLAAFGHAQDLSFFDTDGIDQFVHYLRSEALLQEVTVRKNYKNLMWFLNWEPGKATCSKI